MDLIPDLPETTPGHTAAVVWVEVGRKRAQLAPCWKSMGAEGPVWSYLFISNLMALPTWCGMTETCYVFAIQSNLMYRRSACADRQTEHPNLILVDILWCVAKTLQNVGTSCCLKQACCQCAKEQGLQQGNWHCSFCSLLIIQGLESALH